MKAYRLHNKEWGIEGETKYISAYDAMSYPKVDFKKVEDVITKKEGDTLLKGLLLYVMTDNRNTFRSKENCVY